MSPPTEPAAAPTPAPGLATPGNRAPAVPATDDPMPEDAGRHSLRARLLGFLLGAIVLVALAQAAVAYRAALAEADAIFDYHMQQTATSLGAGLPIGAVAPPGGEIHDNFDFIVQVWNRDGLQIFQSAPRARLPQLAVLGFADVAARGTTYRVLSLETARQTIQVAQDMGVRRSLARGLALRTVAPVLALAPLLMLVVWWVVRRSLAPVARVRAQVSERAAGDLSPVDEQGLPAELRPLVHEINLLFERVRLAFETQTHFVADAAHELRTPLTALKLQLQGLQRSADGAGRELAVSRLSAGVDRATRLVEQLLALAREESRSGAGLARLRFDLAEAARAEVALAVPAALDRGLEIAFDAALPGRIEGQPEAVGMLLRNLLDNAIKYTPVGGRIDVLVRAGAPADAGLLPASPVVELIVEDSGPGISAADRERVFDRFYRVPGSDAGGSGLGLAIVQTIARAHGASLRLGHSTRLGGLRVVLGFPMLPGGGPPTPGSAAGPTGPDAPGRPAGPAAS